MGGLCCRRGTNRRTSSGRTRTGLLQTLLNSCTPPTSETSTVRCVELTSCSRRPGPPASPHLRTCLCVSAEEVQRRGRAAEDPLQSAVRDPRDGESPGQPETRQLCEDSNIQLRGEQSLILFKYLPTISPWTRIKHSLPQLLANTTPLANVLFT